MLALVGALSVNRPGLAAEPASPPVEAHVGMRLGARAQNLRRPHRLDQISLDTLYVEPRFNGRLTEILTWQASFNVSVPDFDGFEQNALRIMDLTIRVQPHDLFNVWAGRLIVPGDRTNLTGPFFISPWNYPGVYAGGFVGPKTGATGRDNGAVVWGQAWGGKAKYYLGAFELVTPQASTPGHHPLYVGRVSASLVGAEPGYYQAGTYYGSQDVVSVGAGLQWQKNGAGIAGARDDVRNLMVDALAEKSIASTGTFTVEAAYYDFSGTPLVKRAFFVLGSYLTPNQVGIGKLQPLVRWQQTFDPGWSVADAGVTYVIRGHDLRVALGYQRADTGMGRAANAIQLGVQLQQ